VHREDDGVDRALADDRGGLPHGVSVDHLETSIAGRLEPAAVIRGDNRRHRDRRRFS
jgi:hypothetical protein